MQSQEQEATEEKVIKEDIIEEEETVEESINDNNQKNNIDVWNLSYYVTFLDDDKSVIQRSIYKYGSMPSCSTPETKIVDGYEYTFKSWSPSIHTVKGTQIYIATYTRRYAGDESSFDGGGNSPVDTDATVKYKDADGNIKSVKITAGTTVTIDIGSVGSITGPDSITLTENQTLDLTIDDYTPTPTVGYAFKGYTYDSSSKKFTVNYEYGFLVTVSFDLQGHGSAIVPQTIYIYANATKPATDPTATGYVFKGWYKEAACTHEWNFDSETVPANTTIYAKWITDLSDRILKAKTIYIDGEPACLSDSANSVININGIDCYVLKVDGDKAELITKDLYETVFNSTNTGAESEYNYSTSDLKTWMDNFYTSKLKSGHDSESGDKNAILETAAAYYCRNNLTETASPDNPEIVGTVNQYVFALDFGVWDYIPKFSWSNAGWGSLSFFWLSFGGTTASEVGISKALVVRNNGTIFMRHVDNSGVGARPAFWISLD